MCIRDSNDYGCYTDFIRLKEGFTRINVKINAKEETEVNGQGPLITGEAISLLYGKLDRLEEGDAVSYTHLIPHYP